MKITLSLVFKDGLLRPKSYVKLLGVGENLPTLSFERYVLARAPLFRLRLWLAKRELVKMERKAYKFVINQKISV
jgi:hypothetical protein